MLLLGDSLNQEPEWNSEYPLLAPIDRGDASKLPPRETSILPWWMMRQWIQLPGSRNRTTWSLTPGPQPPIPPTSRNPYPWALRKWCVTYQTRSLTWKNNYGPFMSAWIGKARKPNRYTQL